MEETITILEIYPLFNVVDKLTTLPHFNTNDHRNKKPHQNLCLTGLLLNNRGGYRSRTDDLLHAMQADFVFKTQDQQSFEPQLGYLLRTFIPKLYPIYFN
jgi:hypothetical protein